MQDLVYIDGVLMPTPRTYTVNRSDIHSKDSGRSETAVMNINRVRAGVYKIMFSWRVSKTQLLRITNAISAKTFTVTFFDPTTATSNKTCTMYAGDRSAAMVLNDDDALCTWWDLTVNFIEV